VRIIRVNARPVGTLAERLAHATDDRVACVLVSSVLFESAEIVPHLGIIAAACLEHGAELLVDAYHHLNVVPFDLQALGLERAFITGGGYKYCQLGEGNCFLRVPPDCELRPVFTGWFSEFEHLAVSHAHHAVHYGRGGERFAGATYDPTSHYRAAAVFRFHEERGLHPARLREINARQTESLVQRIRALDLDVRVAQLLNVPADSRGGFIAIRSSRAATVVATLRGRGVYADSRSDILRLGPAPYVSDEQLEAAAAELAHALRTSTHNPSD
jgi:kynureninase